MEERTTKVSRGLDELRIEHASRLDQAVASTVTDSLTASVVETSIQERIAQVEKDTERRLYDCLRTVVCRDLTSMTRSFS